MLRNDTALKPETGYFRQALVDHTDTSDLAGQTDLPDRGKIGAKGPVNIA